MNRILLIGITFLTVTYSSMGQSQDKTPLTIGESVTIESTVLDESRQLNIYLPESYHPDSSRTYPVIYLLDGAMNEDFIHIVGNVQFCSFSWINIIPKSIVVGIANVDRKRDFTYPSSNLLDQKEFPTSGKSKAFIEFISKELQPFIKSNYKINDESTIIGQSLGGLLATQILFEQPELFDRFIIISPSLWWDDEKILKQTLTKSLENKSIYVAGGNEGPVMIRLAQTLFNKLAIEKSSEAKVVYKFFEQQSHGDVLHLAVYDAFEKIFPKTK